MSSGGRTKHSTKCAISFSGTSSASQVFLGCSTPLVNCFKLKISSHLGRRTTQGSTYYSHSARGRRRVSHPQHIVHNNTRTSPPRKQRHPFKMASGYPQQNMTPSPNKQQAAGYPMEEHHSPAKMSNYSHNQPSFSERSYQHEAQQPPPARPSKATELRKSLSIKHRGA